MPLTFISMFSGIEAASVAFGPLGWRPLVLAEIEKFPSAVLAHHYPDAPNVGDMTAHDWAQYHPSRNGGRRVDIVCGGPPCQAFSVAGLRESMNDARGNLSLEYVRALHAIEPRNAITENVPGWLSTPDNAFGCFLAGLVGADDALCSPDGKRWPDAGMVAGPRARAAWRILDAQHFGLAQRRRRVIVVADFGNGADPAAVLFERLGLPGYSPASREAREGIAGTISARTQGGGGLGTDFDLDGGVVAYAPEIARCVATREGSSQDFESTTMVAVSATGQLAHTLKAEGADASEDGTGRGTPIIAFDARQSDVLVHGDKTLRAGTHKDSHQNGGVAPAVTVALRGREGGATAELGGEVATALRASGGGGDKPHVLVGGLPDIAGTMKACAGQTGGFSNSADHAAAGYMVPTSTSAVRRLTPKECERLQGFPDGYTRIPVRWYKNRRITRTRPEDMWERGIAPADSIKHAGENGWWLMSADGPRYKALGNSWAVPKFTWLGRRIQEHMPPVAANDNKEAARAAA